MPNTFGFVPLDIDLAILVQLSGVSKRIVDLDWGSRAVYLRSSLVIPVCCPHDFCLLGNAFDIILVAILDGCF